MPGQTFPNGSPVYTDGDDKLFGDLGNDWLVGGTGRDNMYGGWGNDLLQSDDEHSVLAALHIVEELGKTSSALLPVIQQLAKDPRPEVAKRAQRLARR